MNKPGWTNTAPTETGVYFAVIDGEETVVSVENMAGLVVWIFDHDGFFELDYVEKWGPRIEIEKPA